MSWNDDFSGLDIAAIGNISMFITALNERLLATNSPIQTVASKSVGDKAALASTLGPYANLVGLNYKGSGYADYCVPVRDGGASTMDGAPRVDGCDGSDVIAILNTNFKGRFIREFSVSNPNTDYSTGYVFAEGDYARYRLNNRTYHRQGGTWVYAPDHAPDTFLYSGQWSQLTAGGGLPTGMYVTAELLRQFRDLANEIRWTATNAPYAANGQGKSGSANSKVSYADAISKAESGATTITTASTGRGISGNSTARHASAFISPENWDAGASKSNCALLATPPTAAIPCDLEILCCMDAPTGTTIVYDPMDSPLKPNKWAVVSTESGKVVGTIDLIWQPEPAVDTGTIQHTYSAGTNDSFRPTNIPLVNHIAIFKWHFQYGPG